MGALTQQPQIPEYTKTPHQNLYQKLYEVMKEIDYIQKDKAVSGGGTNYKYVSEAAIKQKVHAALINHRVMFFPYNSEVEGHKQIDSKDKYGNDKTTHLMTLKLYYRFVDIDSGEIVEGALHGMGSDGTEKGIYKAITGALKYIFSGTFLFPTGDDPEKEYLTKEERKHAKTQRSIGVVDTGQVEQESIDIGRNPINTREAANFVRDRKLAEIKAAESAGEMPSNVLTGEEPLWVSQPHEAVKTEKIWTDKPHPQAQVPVPDSIQEVWKRMLGGMEKRIAEFQIAKKRLEAKLGEFDGETKYYEILKRYNAEHSNEISKRPADARQAIAEMYRST